MKKFVFIFILILAITSCKRDAPILKGNTLPFENSNIKLELISNSLPLLIHDIHFFDSLKGIAVTWDSKIFMTINKGASWTLQFANPNPNQPLNKILFINDNVGYVVGGATGCSPYPCNPPGGFVLKTVDGGSNWTKVFTSTLNFSSISSNSLGDLYAISKGISKSTNGASSWTTVDSTVSAFDKIIFANNYGFCTGYLGKIYRSADNGNSWILKTTLDGNYIYDIKFLNNTGFCIANYGNKVYKTNDTGSTWVQTFNSDFSYCVINPLTDSGCLIFGSGNYSGEEFGTYNGAIIQTTNSGNSWTETALSGVGSIGYTSFYSSTEGYAVADRKLIKVTVK